MSAAKDAFGAVLAAGEDGDGPLLAGGLVGAVVPTGAPNEKPVARDTLPAPDSAPCEGAGGFASAPVGIEATPKPRTTRLPGVAALGDDDCTGLARGRSLDCEVGSDATAAAFTIAAVASGTAEGEEDSAGGSPVLLSWPVPAVTIRPVRNWCLRNRLGPKPRCVGPAFGLGDGTSVVMAAAPQNPS